MEYFVIEPRSPPEIFAWQWLRQQWEDWPGWIKESCHLGIPCTYLVIKFGPCRDDLWSVEPGSWIIKNKNGSFNYCNSKQFTALYQIKKGIPIHEQA